MAGNLYLAPDLPDYSFGINKECGPLDANCLFTIHILLFQDLVELTNLPLAITEQGKLQSQFGSKLFMAGDRIPADPEYNGIDGSKLLPPVIKIDRFIGSAWRIVFWIKVKNNPFASKLR